jgi:replicative DNA helicase
MICVMPLPPSPTDFEQIHNDAAEELLVGLMLKSPEAAERACALLAPADLFVARFQAIFALASKLYDRSTPITIAGIDELARESGQSSLVGNMDSLYALRKVGGAEDELDIYIDILRSNSLLRRMEVAGQRVIETARDRGMDARAAAEEAQKLIEAALASKDSDRIESAADLAKRIMDEFDEDRRSGPKRGMMTGLGAMDQHLGGLKKTDLIVIGARPGMGKSALMMKMAVGLAGNNHPTLVFSMEMSAKQLGLRALSSISQVSPRDIQRQDVDPGYEKSYRRAAEHYAELPIFIDDRSSRSVRDIRAQTRQMISLHGIEVVIIDYLGIMFLGKGGGEANRAAAIGDVVKALKTMARDLNITVVLLAQLSRGVESREDKRPRLSDLRDSGEIEQNADIVGLIYRDSYYKAKEAGMKMDPKVSDIMEIAFAKYRNGEVGTIEALFTPAYTSIGDVVTYSGREDGDYDPWASE